MIHNASMLISDEAGPMAEGSLSAVVRGVLARLDYLRTVYNVHYCTVPVQCVHNKVIACSATFTGSFFLRFVRNNRENSWRRRSGSVAPWPRQRMERPGIWREVVP
jgi:hypothetical protein